MKYLDISKLDEVISIVNENELMEVNSIKDFLKKHKNKINEFDRNKGIRYIDR